MAQKWIKGSSICVMLLLWGAAELKLMNLLLDRLLVNLEFQVEALSDKLDLVGQLNELLLM
jgi:hypothetical protein